LPALLLPIILKYENSGKDSILVNLQAAVVGRVSKKKKVTAVAVVQYLLCVEASIFFQARMDWELGQGVVRGSFLFSSCQNITNGSAFTKLLEIL
jgi:hypothetical protein